MRPLEVGNDSTTFVALLTFLKLNGFTIDLRAQDALGWYESIQTRAVDAQEAIRKIAKPSLDHHHVADVKLTVRDFMAEFASTLSALN
jgi:prophage maintenance system killer protein